MRQLWKWPWSRGAHARHCAGSFIAQTAFEPAASEEYGAAAGWTTVEVMAGDRLEVEVGMFVRLPLAPRLPLACLCRSGVLAACLKPSVLLRLLLVLILFAYSFQK